MRVAMKSRLSVLQLIQNMSHNSRSFSPVNIRGRKRDEFIHSSGISPITYTRSSIRDIGKRSLCDALNFNLADKLRSHTLRETEADFIINGRRISKSDIPAVDADWCSPIKAQNNTVRFENGEYYKYTDASGKTHTFACEYNRISQPYSDLRTGRQNDQSRKIAMFWNLLSSDATYIDLYYSKDEQKKMLNDAGIKEGFFTVESGSRKQEYYYSNGRSGLAIRKFQYDATYKMCTKGTALFDKYEIGAIFKIGGRDYPLKEDRTLDIPYGEDILDIQFPKLSE